MVQKLTLTLNAQPLTCKHNAVILIFTWVFNTLLL